MASIDIDPEDYIDEISTENLSKELKKRNVDNIEKYTPVDAKDIANLLDESAQALKETRVDLAFRLEDLNRFYRSNLT